MSNDTVPAADIGLPDPHRDTARNAFYALCAAWEREVTDYHDPATPDERILEIEHNDREWELGRQIVAFPVPLGFLIAKKLDVLTRVAATAGENMSPADRFILLGLGALRADIVNFCG